MATMLLLIGIGPVQDFIERSRRMRDTWFGSHLLSEVSRAAARSLAEGGWQLVFPALSAYHAELQPCEGTRRGGGAPPLGISNKVVALREGATSDDAEAAASAARNAALDAWEAFAVRARRRSGELLASDLDTTESPARIAESFLEVVAAWASYDREGDLGAARVAAEEALAARKTLRSFPPWSAGKSYRKSSLDGARESVLVDRQRLRARDHSKARTLRLPDGEHLDAIGFVKRAGGSPEQFIPLARITVQPWLRAIAELAMHDEDVGSWFARAKTSCQAAATAGKLQTLQQTTSWLQGGQFPYDGEVFFEGQWPAIERDLELVCRDAVGGWRNREVALPDPHPYVACLAADGDRMGRALSGLRSAIEQRALSQELGRFSQEVRAVVEQHDGVLVYAGGDDVLAFLPVVGALACAEELRRSFLEAMGRVPGLHETPTLSVGVAVVHTLTPLGEIVSRAREAERYAKSGEGLRADHPAARNALAVIVDKRSGAPTRWRMQWPAAGAPGLLPGERLRRLADLVEAGRMPHKLPYELRVLRAQLDEMSDDEAPLARCLRLEALRILGRKGGGDGATGLKPGDVDLVLPQSVGITAEPLRTALAEWVDGALVALALGQAGSGPRAIRARVERLLQEGVE